MSIDNSTENGNIDLKESIRKIGDKEYRVIIPSVEENNDFLKSLEKSLSYSEQDDFEMMTNFIKDYSKKKPAKRKYFSRLTDEQVGAWMNGFETGREMSRRFEGRQTTDEMNELYKIIKSSLKINKNKPIEERRKKSEIIDRLCRLDQRFKKYKNDSVQLRKNFDKHIKKGLKTKKENDMQK
jgi:hypothetical protein